VSALNLPGIVVDNINCVGGGYSTNTTDGISVINNQGGTSQLAGPKITNNTVSQYGISCVAIHGNGVNDTNSGGFTNITVSSNTLHDWSYSQKLVTA
jgi:hypothetical protein